MTGICLAMILKDHAQTIQESIRSVKPWISRYSLIDANSSDRSKELALEELEGIEGTIESVEHMPSIEELLSLASCNSSYVLWMNPDETLAVTEPFGPLEKDCYYAIFREKELEWRKPFLLRSLLHWQGGDLLEQDVFAKGAKTARLLYGSTLTKQAGSLSHKSRYEEAIKQDPSNPHLLFHYARCLEEERELNQAFRLYFERSQMGGDNQEVFYSLYRLARLQELRGDPLETVIEAYLKAYHFLPARAEPLYDLTERMIRDENYILGYVLAEFALTIAPPQDPFLQKRFMYEYGILHQFAICAWKIKRFDEAKETLDRLKQILSYPKDLQITLEETFV